MNILFVNYGGPENNSMNHIAGFADSLGQSGNDCVVAVAARAKEGASLWPGRHFRCVSYREISQASFPFRNRRPADLVHAWTPRENVRRAVFAHFREALAAGVEPALLIHLEDNEEAIVERTANRSVEELLNEDQDAARNLPGWISHPGVYRLFLSLADGVSVIIRALGEFVPEHVPWEEIWPGLDPMHFRDLGATRRREIRLEAGVPADARMITYTGNATRVNLDDMQSLYAAVLDLNAQGVPCRLVRSGSDDPHFLASLPFDPSPILLHQGFVPAGRIPDLIQAADVLIQPGAADAFNNYRLPSKIPEFLAAGRPVVLPAANIGLHVTHGREALLIETAEPAELAANTLRIFRDDALASSLGKEGRAFARRHFDRATNSEKLARLHRATLNRVSKRPGEGLRALLKPPGSGPLAEILRHDFETSSPP